MTLFGVVSITQPVAIRIDRSIDLSFSGTPALSLGGQPTQDPIRRTGLADAMRAPADGNPVS